MIRDPSRMRTRVALVGAGRWGRLLLPPLRERFDVPVCVTTGGPEGIEWLRGQGIEATTDMDTVLSDPSIDAVAIATPMESHAALAGRALAAGKHVFVEKPLATSSSDARRAAAAAGDRILFVGHVYLYHPLLHGVRNVPVRSTSSTWRKHGTFDSDLFWNLASHDVSIALSLFGELPAQIEVPMSERDRARIRLGFSGGRDAFIDIDRTSSERSKTLELNGTMVLDLTQGDPLQRELDAFAAAVERGEPFPSDAAHGVAVVETVERIRGAA
jgi:UDP-2-acetamido-3-amino-2,3-dideoxy-glucuronate N-acetyltransferase